MERFLNRATQTLLALATLLMLSTTSTAADKKPNILVIWGDDIGMWNISAYHRGMLGSRTPKEPRQ